MIAGYPVTGRRQRLDGIYESAVGTLVTILSNVAGGQNEIYLWYLIEYQVNYRAQAGIGIQTKQVCIRACVKM
jgi:hypothetical protein